MKTEQWPPGRLMAVSSAYWQGFTIHAGIKLGLFSRIAERQVDARQLAGEMDTEPDATTRLLDALTAMGLLCKADGRYKNTAEGLRFSICPPRNRLPVKPSPNSAWTNATPFCST